MDKLTSCQTNLVSSLQLTILSTQLWINFIHNWVREWLSRRCWNCCQMLNSSKRLLWDTMRTSTTRSWVISLLSRPKYSVRPSKRLSFCCKCTSTIYLSQSETMWMTVNLFWTQVAELLWGWSMLQKKRNCLMRPERVFTFNRPFTKDSGATFLTLLGIFGRRWTRNLMDSLVSSRNITRQEEMKKSWNSWSKMSYNTIQRKNERSSKQSRVSHWCGLTSGQRILTQNQMHRTKKRSRKVEKQ